MIILNRTLLGAALSAALVLPLAQAAQAQYSFTNFDGPVQTPAGAMIAATTIDGISNSGSLVGYTSDNNGAYTNFSGMPGAFTTLNIPTTAVPNGINTSQQVVGTDGASAFTLNSINASNNPLPLPPVNATTTSEAAFGINDSGIIVGQYTDSATGTTPGFLDINGAFTSLNPAMPIAGALVVNAQGINNAGLVVGFYAQNNLGTDQHGFLYDSLTKSYTSLSDPSTAQTANGNLALTQFLGINDSGLAVGYYQTKDTSSQFGFLYDTQTQQYTYLDDHEAAPLNGVKTTQITGLTNAGEIAGFYADANGKLQGFTAVPVPEASSSLGLGLLLLLGGGALALRTHRHRANSAA